MQKRHRILVIDGSRVSRRIISSILMAEMASTSADIATVASGSEALALLQVRRFDLITCSVLLPDISGIDLCRAVRRQNAHRFTPFILVTAEPHVRLMSEGFSAGVTDYYDKTQGLREFVHFVRDFLDRHAALVGKVLYLEDNPVDVRMGTAIMRQHGLTVVQTATAEEALGLIDDGFDLVVADFMLERDMTGGDFLHSLRCGLRYSREELPVLVITAQDDQNLQAEIFHAGGNDFVSKPIIEESFISRVRSLLLMKQQFTELRRHSDEMRQWATTDSLTGLRNKRYLMDRAPVLFARSDNYPMSLAVLDLDRFKEINDRYGHPIGDQVLEGVGRLLQRIVKPGDLVARVGGEEFVMLLLRREPEETAREMEIVRGRIEALCPAGFPVTTSIGFSSNYHRADTAFDELLAEADEAMYRAKQGGRNRVYAHTPGGGGMSPPGKGAPREFCAK